MNDEQTSVIASDESKRKIALHFMVKTFGPAAFGLWCHYHKKLQSPQKQQFIRRPLNINSVPDLNRGLNMSYNRHRGGTPYLSIGNITEQSEDCNGVYNRQSFGVSSSRTAMIPYSQQLPPACGQMSIPNSLFGGRIISSRMGGGMGNSRMRGVRLIFSTIKFFYEWRGLTKLFGAQQYTISKIYKTPQNKPS